MFISKIENYVLPQGWIRCCLPDFTNIVMGQSPTSDTYNKSGNGIPFFQGKAEFGTIYPTVAKYCSNPNKLALSGATLLSVRAPVGPTNLANEKCCIGRGLAAIHPAGSISPMFVLYLLRSIEIDLSRNGTGSTFSAINKQFVEELEFDLPPLNEQHRIVAKIEELFSELDKGIENLKTARAQLKVYRQALLKHAFEGKLTAKWRAERNVIPAEAGIQPFNDMDSRLRGNDELLETADALLKRIQQERAQRYQQQLAEWEATGKQGSKPKAPKLLPPLTAEELVELPELPEGWGWSRLGNTNVDVSDGPFGSNLKSSDYVDSGVRVVRLENIGSLKFIEEKESYITEEKYELLKRHTATSGDIIFSSFIIENVRVALVPPSITKAINKADCFCVRFSGETLSNVFVLLFLSTRHVYKQLESLIHGVGRPRINTTQLKNVVIPVCSDAEQQVIIAEIEARLSEVDQLELTIAASLQQAEALRQSILKKAFSGQLVPQDPHDEPASVLLARIKTDRAGSGKSETIQRRTKKVSP